MDVDMKPPDHAARQNAIASAGLRIGTGCLFLIFAKYKVFGTGFTLHAGFEWWIEHLLRDGASYPFMAPRESARGRGPARGRNLRKREEDPGEDVRSPSTRPFVNGPGTSCSPGFQAFCVRRPKLLTTSLNTK